MKQYLLLSILFICTIGYSQETVSKHALGMRSGLQSGRIINNINYQYQFNAKYRLETNLGIGGAFGENASYLASSGSVYLQRIFNIKAGLGIYAGIGFSGGATRIRNFQNSPEWIGSIGFGPQIGIQYDFSAHKIPLLLSADYRPSIHYGFKNQTLGTTGSIGLSLLYKF